MTDYSFPRERQRLLKDAEAKEGTETDNDKYLESSAELSDLGPGTSSLAGRRPQTPRRANSVCV